MLSNLLRCFIMVSLKSSLLASSDKNFFNCTTVLKCILRRTNFLVNFSAVKRIAKLFHCSLDVVHGYHYWTCQRFCADFASARHTAIFNAIHIELNSTSDERWNCLVAQCGTERARNHLQSYNMFASIHRTPQRLFHQFIFQTVQSLSK